MACQVISTYAQVLFWHYIFVWLYFVQEIDNGHFVLLFASLWHQIFTSSFFIIINSQKTYAVQKELLSKSFNWVSKNVPNSLKFSVTKAFPKNEKIIQLCPKFPVIKLIHNNDTITCLLINQIIYK